MVHQHDRAAGLGDHLGRARIPGQRRDVVDHRRARAERLLHHRRLARVHRDGRPRAASRWITGSTRAASSPSQTGFAPGRVDSPPTSIIAAPAAAIACPAATASSASAYRPPSEKLSGVTLRIPTTCGWSSRITRSPSCSGARGVVSSPRWPAPPRKPRLDPLDAHQFRAIFAENLDRREPSARPRAGRPCRHGRMAHRRSRSA